MRFNRIKCLVRISLFTLLVLFLFDLALSGMPYHFLIRGLFWLVFGFLGVALLIWWRYIHGVAKGLNKEQRLIDIQLIQVDSVNLLREANRYRGHLGSGSQRKLKIYRLIDKRIAFNEG